MKKLVKKAAAFALSAAVAVAALAGCGRSSGALSSGGASSGGAGESSASGSYPDYSAGFPDKVTIKIPVYDRGFEGWNPADNYYTKWVRKEFGDKYNVDVQYVAVSRQNEVQDYMQMIAAHTAPDIIMHYDMPQAVNYYGEGAVQDVDYGELACYAPTYWSNMEQTIEKYGKLDGHNAFIFAARDPIYYNWVNLIRLDWLEKVDLPIPQTREELEKAARAWKKAGLGTIGDMLLTKSFTYEYNFIGKDPDQKDLSLYLDLNVAPFTWQATENYLKTMNGEYNEGILDPEFYLNTDDAKCKAKFVAGKTGTYGFYISSSTDVFSSLLKNEPAAKVAVLPPQAFAPADCNPYYYQYPPYGMIMGINADATAEQRAAVYMLLEWMSRPESLTFLQHGVEGETYTVDSDGIAAQISDYSGEAKLSQNNNKDYWCLVQEVPTYGDEQKDLKANMSNLAPSGYEDLIRQAFDFQKKVEQYGVISAIYTKPLSSVSEYSADLNSLWQQAYVDCITCKPGELGSKYADYSREYLDAGYRDILEEKQSLIDENAYLR